jgi:uncharacterized protein YndB with AHSA1/START domain
MTTTREAQIIVHGDIPAVTIIREFDAPPEKVFRAHTDPEWFVRWVGPDSLDSSTVDVWDCRPGGSWRYVSEHGGEQHWFRGCFHDVRPNELIVQTFSYEGFPDGVSLERLELTDLGDGRTRLSATSLVDSFEGRDAFIASGMETGVQEGYRKLDALLASSVD